MLNRVLEFIYAINHFAVKGDDRSRGAQGSVRVYLPLARNGGLSVSQGALSFPVARFRTRVFFLSVCP